MKLPQFLVEDADGSIRLSDHRIDLASIIFSHREGLSAAQIAEEFPTLRGDLIRQVIHYYLEHRTVLEPYVDRVEAELTRQERATPHGPSFEELKARMLLRSADREI